MHKEVYIQGRISHSQSHSLFECTAVALKDGRIGEIKEIPTQKHKKKGHIIQGETYMIFPKRKASRYVILDQDESVLGIITKSGKYHGWWYFERYLVRGK